MIIWIKKKLIEANEKLYNENADQNIALVENITNNKLSEIELKKKKKQEQELAEKIEASKIHLENKKNKSLLEFSKFTEDIKQKTNRIISDAKIDIENEFKKINQDNINQNKSLKFENEQLTKQIEQQKTELKELSDNKLALTEIQNNKVAVNTHILDKVAKHISDTSDAKIIKILNKIEEDHNIEIDIDKRKEYRKAAKIEMNEVYGTFEKFVKGFKETLDKLSIVAKKVINFGINRGKNHHYDG